MKAISESKGKDKEGVIMEDTMNSDVINYYPGHMAKAKREVKEKIKLIDIVIEVLDARMPSSSKIDDIEDIIGKKPKILVMTKKDLCDMSRTKKIAEEYKYEGYDNVLIMDLNNNSDYKELIDVCKKMMEPINEKRKEKGLKDKEIKIGVVGIPNVGKSTLINKLAGRKVANVGNKPGVTKDVNWLKTDYGFLLLDTPGILWPRMKEHEQSFNLASTGTIKTDILNMTDIGGYLVSFYQNEYKWVLKDIYGIEPNIDIFVNFRNLAEKFGYITKEGYTDYEKVSTRLYNDLVGGKITGVTFDKC